MLPRNRKRNRSNNHDPCLQCLLLTLSLPVTHCADHNNDLSSNNNISKMVRVNIAFKATFLKLIFISFLMIPRLIDFTLVVL